MSDRGNNNTTPRKALGEGSEMREIKKDRTRGDISAAMSEDCHRGLSSGCHQVSSHRGSADQVRRNYKQ